jgi:hypothetical protein
MSAETLNEVFGGPSIEVTLTPRTKENIAVK